MSETLLAEQPLLVRLLLEQGAIQEKDLAEIQKAMAQTNMPTEEALVQSQIVDESAVSEAYANYLHLPLLEAGKPASIDREMAQRIGEKVCWGRGVVPLSCDHGTLEVAFVNPTDLTAMEEIQLFTGLVVRPVVARLSQVQEALGEVFGKRDFVKEISKEAGQEMPNPPATRTSSRRWWTWTSRWPRAATAR